MAGRGAALGAVARSLQPMYPHCGVGCAHCRHDVDCRLPVHVGIALVPLRRVRKASRRAINRARLASSSPTSCSTRVPSRMSPAGPLAAILRVEPHPWKWQPEKGPLWPLKKGPPRRGPSRGVGAGCARESSPTTGFVSTSIRALLGESNNNNNACGRLWSGRLRPVQVAGGARQRVHGDVSVHRPAAAPAPAVIGLANTTPAPSTRFRLAERQRLVLLRGL